ncbi:helix-turn-helix domain-containing protein [Burkholderia pseudomallei]|uniref:helix-turn-helix domain-containing protein n=1 Tax=Burkholderia pseudomallei TaxID=28450 RepID=UPI00016B1624|nr:helix-turn-helix domain-containing protein [Burkholderia pseudomallei]MEB5486668.1 helix-turn-helix domain-containing protein [Burkholderia pseudomallei]MEB5492648.1 helix-turn-helix domain-containing protein [Burkholderia pseudomallei]MEB5498883.1 helix-turn-helix domain-containing protein [Burkholderia pseudomallei]MEB5506580.1 helix-turn-helix domain-containing protein [Burkholderia pseudomallei]MEB5512707.1 helix-turn-helix domain-containing protein [Burkholderia pseudomallei]
MRQVRRLPRERDRQLAGRVRVAGERFAISRGTLRRRLHHEALTFHALLTRARIGEAERRRRHTRLPIGAIGARVGFGSASAFSRFFTRARRGVEPLSRRARRQMALSRAISATLAASRHAALSCPGICI